MKVKHLSINNFRGFRQAEVEFPDSNLAVFIGVNGQGKSSLLDLVAMFLNQFTSLLSHPAPAKDQPYQLRPTDVHVPIEGSITNTEHTIWIEQDNKIAEWQNGYSYISSIGSGMRPLNLGDEFDSMLNRTRENLAKKKETASLPILLYLRANRFFDNNYEPSKDEPHHKAPQFAAYENAFSKKITDFADFANWFRIEEDKENERIKKERNFDLTNPSLQPVRKAVVNFFSKLNGFSFSNLRVEREMAKARDFALAGSSSSLVISKNNQDFRLEQLSDGEKMLLMVVCDIARRLSIANPGLPDPLEGRGIVLIDEIELHLHPKWQREVIPALLATFPNIQFLLSTHSPQVLSRVDSKDIFLLQDGEVLKLSSNPKGMDTNAILEEVMDTPKYPREVDDLVDEMFAFIQQRKFGQAESARHKVAEASPDNPVLQRADAMMERLKILN